MSDESVTISSEKIANGYLVRTSRCGPDGDYTSTTEFSPTKPEINGSAKAKPQAAGPSSLAKAVQLLR